MNMRLHKKNGFTLVEITLVIALVLGLMATLTLGIKAYQNGVAKARCLMSMDNIYKNAIGIAGMDIVDFPKNNHNTARQNMAREMNKITKRTTWFSQGNGHSGMAIYLNNPCPYLGTYTQSGEKYYYMTLHEGTSLLSGYQSNSMVRQINADYYMALQCISSYRAPALADRHSWGLND